MRKTSFTQSYVVLIIAKNLADNNCGKPMKRNGVIMIFTHGPRIVAIRIWREVHIRMWHEWYQWHKDNESYLNIRISPDDTLDLNNLNRFFKLMVSKYYHCLKRTTVNRVLDFAPVP